MCTPFSDACFIWLRGEALRGESSPPRRRGAARGEEAGRGEEAVLLLPPPAPPLPAPLLAAAGEPKGRGFGLALTPPSSGLPSSSTSSAPASAPPLVRVRACARKASLVFSSRADAISSRGRPRGIPNPAPLAPASRCSRPWQPRSPSLTARSTAGCCSGVSLPDPPASPPTSPDKAEAGREKAGRGRRGGGRGLRAVGLVILSSSAELRPSPHASSPHSSSSPEPSSSSPGCNQDHSSCSFTCRVKGGGISSFGGGCLGHPRCSGWASSGPASPLGAPSQPELPRRAPKRRGSRPRALPRGHFDHARSPTLFSSLQS